MTGRRKGCFWIWWDSEEKEEEAICSEGKGRGGLVVLRPKHSTSIYSTKYQSQECISFVYFCRHNPWNIVFLFNMLKLRIWKVMNISYSFNIHVTETREENTLVIELKISLCCFHLFLTCKERSNDINIDFKHFLWSPWVLSLVLNKLWLTNYVFIISLALFYPVST